MRLALYQPDIPQNVGAAIRAAACFGARLDIIAPCGFPLDSRKIGRVAMDYGNLAAPTVHDGWRPFCDASRPARLILLTTRATETIWDFAFQDDDILLMGRESAGAPDEVHQAADARLRIPLAPEARSLNITVAAAVALAEARRQLGWETS
ncbi:MAG: TrmH family RNA methyltransferase [Pseudomonadota bacterium]